MRKPSILHPENDTTTKRQRNNIPKMESTIQTDKGFIQAKQPWLRNAGIFSLFLYALFWLWDIEISRTGESLMFLSFVIMLFIDKPKFLLKEHIPYLLFAWIVFQIGVYQWSSITFPELTEKSINEARLITNIFMFIVVAWWMEGNTKRITTTLLLCVIGYSIGIIFQKGGIIDVPSKYFSLTRDSLGYVHAEHTSVYSAFVLLIVITLHSRIRSYFPADLQWLAKSLMIFAVTLSSTTIIATQTRATWLGLFAIGSLFAVIKSTKWIHGHFKKSGNQQVLTRIPKGLAPTLFAIAGILILLGAMNSFEVVTKRISQEKGVYTHLINGHIDDIPLTSIGIRIELWELGIDLIKQRPITGWGAASRRALITQSNLPNGIKKILTHFHNSYVDILVAYGVIGLLLYAWLFFYIWYRAWQARKSGILPSDIFLFASMWSIYWLIVNCFESYILFSVTANYLNAIILGILYTYHLVKIKDPKPSFSSLHTEKPFSDTQ